MDNRRDPRNGKTEQKRQLDFLQTRCDRVAEGYVDHCGYGVRPRVRRLSGDPGSQVYCHLLGAILSLATPSWSHQLMKRARATPQNLRSSSDPSMGTVSTSVASLR